MIVDGQDGLSRVVSARELIEAGYADDVRLALQQDVTSGVPTLVPGTRRFSPEWDG